MQLLFALSDTLFTCLNPLHRDHPFLLWSLILRFGGCFCYVVNLIVCIYHSTLVVSPWADERMDVDQRLLAKMPAWPIRQ